MLTISRSRDLFIWPAARAPCLSSSVIASQQCSCRRERNILFVNREEFWLSEGTRKLLYHTLQANSFSWLRSMKALAIKKESRRRAKKSERSPRSLPRGRGSKRHSRERVKCFTMGRSSLHGDCKARRDRGKLGRRFRFCQDQLTAAMYIQGVHPPKDLIVVVKGVIVKETSSTSLDLCGGLTESSDLRRTCEVLGNGSSVGDVSPSLPAWSLWARCRRTLRYCHCSRSCHGTRNPLGALETMSGQHLFFQTNTIT